MDLSIEEGDYIQELIKHTKNVYGDKWERILRKEALPLPEKGFSQRTDRFEEFTPRKEEKVLKQLKEKGLIVIRKHEPDIEREGDFLDKYGDRGKTFLGINPDRMQEVKEKFDH